VALSGGGSRAAAFHCGTIRALARLELFDRVSVVSSVSGGSVFAGAWAAAAGAGAQGVVTLVTDELRKGFVRRALLNPRLLLVLSPWYSRTEVLASVFRGITRDLTLGALPSSPQFCFNTTVLNW
jgi:NTE family protein